MAARPVPVAVNSVEPAATEAACNAVVALVAARFDAAVRAERKLAAAFELVIAQALVAALEL